MATKHYFKNPIRRIRSIDELLSIYHNCFFCDEERYMQAIAGNKYVICDIGMDFAVHSKFDEAIDCWINIEEYNIPEVFNNLGVSYFYGNGVIVDQERALYYYRKSQELGNDFGIYNVGVCYEQGVGGVCKDIQKAIELYKIAAEMGNHMAISTLERMGELYDLKAEIRHNGINGASRYYIEQGTNYAYKLCKNKVTFNSVYELASEFITNLSKDEKIRLFSQLKRGVEILDSEPLLNMYLFSYGKMHSAKLSFAFKHLPQNFIKEKDICIIDYGCGQGLGFICYADYLKKYGYHQNISKIILIEPSEFCIKRAGLHAQQLFPDADLYCVCKTFNELKSSDLFVGANLPCLNILSNVLDMKSVNIEELAKTIKYTPYLKKQFVCVSPYINNYSSNKLDTFAKVLEADVSFNYNSFKGDFVPFKNWTCDIRIFSTQNNELLYNNLIAEANIIEHKCRAEMGTIMGDIFLEKAENKYLEALKICETAAGYYNLANLMKDFEQYDKAIKYYEKSLHITQDNEAFCNLGVCYYNKSDYINAINCFKKAVEINPYDHISYYNMGNAYYSLGDAENAERYYSIAKDVYSN